MDALSSNSTSYAADALDDRSAKRTSTSVLLRSLDVQPLPSMRIRPAQLARSPLASTSLAKAAATAKQTHSQQQQQQQRPSAAPVPTASAAPALSARLQQLWKLNAWFIFAVSLLFCIARVSAAGILSSSSPAAASESSNMSASSDWYIVLVSIPVLDKVLPLKHLAEELLHRGYRVGFALPEVRQRVLVGVYGREWAWMDVGGCRFSHCIMCLCCRTAASG